MVAAAGRADPGRDDLEDGLDLDASLLASSEASGSGILEDQGDRHAIPLAGEASEDDDPEAWLSEEDEGQRSQVNGSSRLLNGGTKRKAVGEADDEATRTAEKKRRKKEREKRRKARVCPKLQQLFALVQEVAVLISDCICSVGKPTPLLLSPNLSYNSKSLNWMSYCSRRSAIRFQRQAAWR